MAAKTSTATNTGSPTAAGAVNKEDIREQEKDNEVEVTEVVTPLDKSPENATNDIRKRDEEQRKG